MINQIEHVLNVLIDNFLISSYSVGDYRIKIETNNRSLIFAAFPDIADETPTVSTLNNVLVAIKDASAIKDFTITENAVSIIKNEKHRGEEININFSEPLDSELKHQYIQVFKVAGPIASEDHNPLTIYSDLELRYVYRIVTSLEDANSHPYDLNRYYLEIGKQLHQSLSKKMTGSLTSA